MDKGFKGQTETNQPPSDAEAVSQSHEPPSSTTQGDTQSQAQSASSHARADDQNENQAEEPPISESIDDLRNLKIQDGGGTFQQRDKSDDANNRSNHSSPEAEDQEGSPMDKAKSPDGDGDENADGDQYGEEYGEEYGEDYYDQEQPDDKDAQSKAENENKTEADPNSQESPNADEKNELEEDSESPVKLEALQNLAVFGRNAALNMDNMQEATANFKTPTLNSLSNTKKKLEESPRIATLQTDMQESEKIKIDQIGDEFGEQIANEELTLQDKDIFINGKPGELSVKLNAAVSKQSPSKKEKPEEEILTPVVESGRDTADLLAKSEAQKARKNTYQNKSGQFSNDNLDLKKQAQSTNMNLLSYQTANFGAAGDQATKRGQAKEANDRNESQMDGDGEHAVIRNESQQSISQNHMFSSMSDINFVAAASEKKQVPEFKPEEQKSTITDDQRQKMTDTSNHWKVRTSTIDEIHISIQAAIESNPDQILLESENLLEFFVSLLNDQNFKIVLMTLSIVNLVIGMPQHLERAEEEAKEDETRQKSSLTSQSLGKYIPRLVGKLADSKNIIRQQAIRALMGIYLIMRSHSIQSAAKSKSSPVPKGQPNAQNNFVPLVLPYLYNSSSWHVREELLNVLIICFLKSKNIATYGNSVYEFDQYKILEVLLQMLDDQKERIRFTALEAIVAFVSIGNKLSAQEIIYQLGDNSISELIKERLKAPAEMSPYLNENGALELPYLEHVEIANQMQVDQILQRREGLNSGPAGQIKSLSSHPMNQGKRGNSSGRKVQVAPQSANSLANAAQNANGNKRTASANNPKYMDPQFQQQNSLHLHQLGQSAKQNKQHIQSPLYNMFSNHKTALSDFGGANTSAPSGAMSQHQQYGSSYRVQNQRQSNERLGSGSSSSFLPQLQKQNSMRNQNQETPTQSLYQGQQFYGASAGPLNQGGVLQGMLRGHPGSENRFYSHQSEPGSSFYSNNVYHRKVSANSQSHAQQLLQNGPNALLGGQSNNLANHPINLLKNGTDFMDQDSQSDVGYLGIKHPPIQMLNQHHKPPTQNYNVQSNYYKKTNQQQLIMLQQNFSESQQKRMSPKVAMGSNASNAGQHSQHSGHGETDIKGAQPGAPPYETQTQSSYYSRKNTRSQGSYTQQSLATQNSNRAVGQVLNSGGSMGEGPLQFTPASRGISGGGPGVGGQQSGPHPKGVKNGNTFYSDGSMMTNTTTTSTQVANKLKQKQHLQLSLVGKAPGGQQQISQAEEQQQQAGVLGNRGPIKATRYAVMRKEDSNRNLNGAPPQPEQQTHANQQPQQNTELCIDNRKPKRPLGSDSYKIDPANSDLAEFMNNYQIPKNSNNGKEPLEIYQQTSHLAPGENNLRKENFTILSDDKGGHGAPASELGVAQATHNKNYLTTDELEPIKNNADKVFKTAIQELVSGADWNIQFEACNTVRRVCKFHQDLVLQHGATLHSLVKQLTKLADSLRSSLSKQALITIRDMFQFLKRCMETYLDPLIKILLKKASDTSVFISDEATQALITMTINCSDTKILHVLLSQQVNSKQTGQRVSICRCLEQLVANLGNNILFFKDSDKLIGQLANYLKDACQEVRASSKRAFVSLQNAVMGQNDLEKLLLRVLNEQQYKEVRRFLDQEPHQLDYYLQPQQKDFVIKNANHASNTLLQLQKQQITVASPTDGGNYGLNPGHSSQNSQTLIGKIGQDTPTSKGERQGSQMGVAGNGVALGQNATKQIRAMGAAKGTLRTGTMTSKAREHQNSQLVQSASGSLNLNSAGVPMLGPGADQHLPTKSGLSVQSAFSQNQANNNGGDLNIKATKIINPKKIIKIGGRPNLKTKNSFSSQASYKASEHESSATDLNQLFLDQIKEIGLKVQLTDWKARMEAIELLFTLIYDNLNRFQSNQKQQSMSVMTDHMCKLVSDQNAKIQLNALEKLSQILSSIVPFVEAHLIQIFGALCLCLSSTNTAVRKHGEEVMCKLYDNVNKGLLVQPMCNEIQYSQSQKLKPILIDHLSDFICDNCSPGQVSKLLLPLAYRLMDDSRSEVKQKTEKLLRKLHFLVGQQVVDMCPHNKLQRVIDLVFNNQGLTNGTAGGTSSSLAAGGGTFGAVGAANLILQSNNNSSNGKH